MQDIQLEKVKVQKITSLDQIKAMLLNSQIKPGVLIQNGGKKVA